MSCIQYFMTLQDQFNPQAAEEAELAQFMQLLTKEMQTKFTGLLDSVLNRVDEMTSRIEELEKNVNELIVASAPIQE